MSLISRYWEWDERRFIKKHGVGRLVKAAIDAGDLPADYKGTPSIIQPGEEVAIHLKPIQVKRHVDE